MADVVPSAGIQVRRARSDDHATLVRFNAAMARETEQLELEPARLAAGVQAALDDVGRGTYWVAERDGRSLGSLLVTREWSDWRNGWVWWIQSVYVDPSARRCGVYRSLYAHVLARSRQEGAVGLRLYVDAENRAAQATYERLGMVESHYVLFEAADPLRR